MARRSIVHVEIPASDRDITARFYQDLFEWDFEHIAEPVSYTMFEAGNSAGGYPNLSEFSQADHVLIYVNSADIDADLKKAEALGGRMVTPRTEIPGFGWFGVFADPTGNRISLWTPAMEARPQ